MSFCRICTAMCGIVVTVDGDQIVKVRGDADHPFSRGYVCPKGRALGAFHHHPRRLDQPTHRGQAVGWTAATEAIGAQLRTLIDERGPDSIAMYLASGSAFDTNGRRAAERFLTVIGSKQKYTATTIDTPCRPLVAELMGGWSGLTPIADYEQSSLLIFVGSNPVVSHGHSNGLPDPVRRLREFQARGGRVVVVDPRRTETAALADTYLAIRPSTDHVLFGFVVRELLAGGADHNYLARHTGGADDLERAVAPFDLATTSAHTGLDKAQLIDLVAQIRRAGRISALTGTGCTMSPHANVTEWLVWCTNIITGSYDQPGGMWFNPGYLRQLDQREWRPTDGEAEPGPASRPELPRRFGEYPCAALVSEIEAGNVRALIVVGGNPIVAFPDRDRLARALATLELVVVVDVIETDTTPHAHYLLPAAGQLERADLTLALESYTVAIGAQYTPAVVAPAAQRRLVWQIFDDLARTLGKSVLPRGVDASTATDEALLAELTLKARDPRAVWDDRHGVIHSGPIYGWVTERVLPGGRWRLAPPPLADQLAAADLAGPPLALIPHRQLRTMNSQLRDTAAPGGKLADVAVVVNPVDAERLGLTDGQPSTVSTPIGSVTGVTRVDPALRAGACTITHGWAEPNVSVLTSAERVDPLTGMVTQSGLPVAITAT